MIIVGGEPPFIETPEPRFGEVIKKMNKVVLAVQQATSEFNENNESKLDTITQLVEDFTSSVALPIDAHLAARGAVHGETKASIGLSKKDNFRVATKQEQINLSSVLAFVTPEGAKASLIANNGLFNLTDYQNNDLFPFASWYYPDQYPIQAPTRVEPPRYFGAEKKVGLLFNYDKLLFSPSSDGSRYTDQSIFTSLPVGSSKGSALGEIQGLNARYLTASWNTVGCDMSDGSVAFFRPLAEKRIYQYKSNLGLPAGNRNYLLYNFNASLAMRGLAVVPTFAGTKVTLTHKFFHVNKPQTDPTLEEVIGQGYLATFDRFDKPSYTGPANGSQTFDLLDYVNLPAGATLEVGGGSHGIVTTLFWNVQNLEMYLHVAVPVIAKLNGASRNRLFSCLFSVVPGGLVAGGGAVFKQLGTRAKDTLNSDLLPTGTPNWITQTSRFNLYDPTQYPGVVLSSGELVKSASTKNGLRIKRLGTSYKGIKDFLLSSRPTVDSKVAVTELYTPSRHESFGGLPERIIPYYHSVDNGMYLVYGANPVTGRFGWRDFIWAGASLVSTQSGDGTFGIALAPTVKDNENISAMPTALMTYVNKGAAGAAPNALAFSEANNFVGKASFSYANGVLTVGADVTMPLPTKLVLQAAAGGVVGRAAKANPLVDASLRKGVVQVYALTPNKALVIISDGLNYAEAAVADYTLANNVFTLAYTTTGGIKLSPVTAGNQAAVTGNRTSASGDDVWMNYTDLLAVRVDANTYNVVVARAFGGEVYGDVSFTVSGLTSASPAFTAGRVNPARLYQGNDAFDCVDEIYPAILIPNKGVYQHDPANTRFVTMMNEIGGTTKVDPFNINEAGWVRLPAGAKFVVNGRTCILDRDYAVKAGATGTWYLYMQRVGVKFIVTATSAKKEPANNEIQFGVVNNGILTLLKSYIVMDNRTLSATRHGAAVPFFADEGGQGVNQFFTKRDVKS